MALDFIYILELCLADKTRQAVVSFYGGHRLPGQVLTDMPGEEEPKQALG